MQEKMTHFMFQNRPKTEGVGTRSWKIYDDQIRLWYGDSHNKFMAHYLLKLKAIVHEERVRYSLKRPCETFFQIRFQFRVELEYILGGLV